MKYVSNCLVFSLLILCFCREKPEHKDTYSVHFQRNTIRSKILIGERVLSIYLPPAYEETGDRYPVLYLLDGLHHIFHTAGMVDYLIGAGRIPEMIIVGIHSTDRYRDYTPDAVEHHAGTGKAEYFTAFLTDELFPFIENTYRIQPYRILFGHSYGGSYVFNLLMTNPELFDGYIAASPNLLILKNLEERLDKRLKSKAAGNKGLFISAGAHEKDFIEIISNVYSAINNHPAVQTRWQFEILDRENHSSTPHKTLYTGLEHLFRDYWHFDDKSNGEKLQKQFRLLSDQLGYEIKVPLAVLVNLGNIALGNEKLDQAQSIFEYLIALYPESEWGYASLGSVFYSKKDKQKAIHYFRKTLTLDPENAYAKDMLKELQQ